MCRHCRRRVLDVCMFVFSARIWIAVLFECCCIMYGPLVLTEVEYLQEART